MSKGFTIIELMISIFILTIAIVGIFSAFAMVVVLTSDVANRLTATYLAQEGMEVVMNIRDRNWIKIYSEGTTTLAKWTDGLENCENGCEADYAAGSLKIGAEEGLKQGTGTYLYINNGFYDYDDNNGDQTIFQRKIIVAPLTDTTGDNSYILKVIVQVSWDKKATLLGGRVLASDCENSNCITTEETLYDWFNY